MVHDVSLDPTRLNFLSSLVNPDHDFRDVANSVTTKIHTNGGGDNV